MDGTVISAIDGILQVFREKYTALDLRLSNNC
jgi:hypothetical protein